MNILIVSDAWHPQVNGVVRTLDTTIGELRLLGHAMTCVGPDRFRTIACPTYPEIRLAVNASRRMAKEIAAIKPDAIHIATEGPLGIAARQYCVTHRMAFTTAYHTRFPEYVHARMRVPVSLTYRMLRRFHRPSRRIMVATQSIRDDLAKQGFENLCEWSRGVDTELFHPDAAARVEGPGPIWLYVGRVAVEKKHRGIPQT